MVTIVKYEGNSMNKNLLLALSFLLSVSAAVAGEKDVPLMLQPVAVKN